ncbi:hypothetical protein L1987_70750 [Smallanthus sonchifolius]|uniref:Uncharacterized protein n=1 Tax=Smallanthus sonchifolius TaxID=185202 RepID=A0ACB9ARE0_9ASTR|nr:hypothetical protein L1987_70750 [Smallanthus sonchifolius]
MAYSSGTTKIPLGGSVSGASSGTGTVKTLSGGSGPGASSDTPKTPTGGSGSSSGASSGTGTLKTLSGSSGPGTSSDTTKTPSGGFGVGSGTGTTKTPLGGFSPGASPDTGTTKTPSGGSGPGAGSGTDTMKTLSGVSGASFGTGTMKKFLDGSGSGSYLIQSSGSEEDLQHLMDQRRKNRMISNRESARRSRKRKQKHLDDLTTQLSQLRKQNNEMIASVNITTQHYMNIETENQVLRARVAELSHQLQSLNDIIGFMYPSMDTGCGFVEEPYGDEFVDELMNNSLSYVYANQPILASADMLCIESDVDLLEILKKGKSDLLVGKK